MSSPNSTGNNYLLSVAGISGNDVWAVGNSTSATHYDRTLAEHWNGSSWTVVSTPNPSSFHSDLTGVSAVSANDVWAVGEYQFDSNTNHWHAFAEHWNGTIWTLDKTTINPTSFSILSAVTVVSSTDVWAVGTFSSHGLFALTEHWDGSHWQWVSSLANPSPTDNELVAVSAWSAGDIWAVGEFSGTTSGSTPPRSWAEHFDGSSWSIVDTPNLGGPGAANVILGVTALEGDHALGVGYGNLTGSTPREGSAWDLVNTNGSSTASTVQSESGPGAGDNALLGVARSGPGVVAVGYWRNTATSARQTLAMAATWAPSSHTVTWGGQRASGSPSSISNALGAVVAITPNVFWASGYQSAQSTDHTLTELYCGLHFNVSAPATATIGVPFSVTVTAANPDASTATTYGGSVHFSSTDPLAVLPADYTFAPGDNGIHTFSGVVLNSPYAETITVSDNGAAFETGSAVVNAHCPGACQSSAGVPGSRDVMPGPTPAPSGGGAVVPGPTPGSGTRAPLRYQSAVWWRL